MAHAKAKQNRKSGYISATHLSIASSREANLFATKSKTSANYWMGEKRLFKFERKNAAGIVVSDANYSCRMSFQGRREQFQLNTANKSEAASKAANIYRDVVGKGWEEALRIYKPKIESKVEALLPATIGSLIEASLRLSKAREETKDTYAKALRRIASGVFEVSKGRKFDAFKGGHQAWLEKIDRIPLAQLTPSAVLAWQNRFMKAVRTPEERGHAAVTMNSIIRNAKALLSKKVRPFIEQEMQLPSPLFFEGITKEEEPSLSYSSTINAETILRNAQTELASNHPELYKLLLLTLVCGLRRSEADTLLWSQFNFQKGLLVIKDTEHKRLKSRDSGGEIDLEPQVCALFQGYREKSLGPFVLEHSTRTRVPALQDRKSRGYRCDQTHKNLVAWLRKQGVNGLRPIHMMRKEIGSIIASRDGIWKASRYLRHSEIGITSRIYADKKDRVTSGLASFLGSPGPATEHDNAGVEAAAGAGIQ